MPTSLPKIPLRQALNRKTVILAVGGMKMLNESKTKLDQATDILSKLLKKSLPAEIDNQILSAQELLLAVQYS